MDGASDLDLISAPPATKYDHRAYPNLWHSGRRRLEDCSPPVQCHEPMKLNKGDGGIVIAT